jgi:hypothetical protein
MSSHKGEGSAIEAALAARGRDCETREVGSVPSMAVLECDSSSAGAAKQVTFLYHYTHGECQSQQCLLHLALHNVLRIPPFIHILRWHGTKSMRNYRPAQLQARHTGAVTASPGKACKVAGETRERQARPLKRMDILITTAHVTLSLKMPLRKSTT